MISFLDLKKKKKLNNSYYFVFIKFCRVFTLFKILIFTNYNYHLVFLNIILLYGYVLIN
jgi:hypothetical protein